MTSQNTPPVRQFDLDNMPEIPRALIAGALPAGGKCVVTGASKTYKSWVLLAIALSLASGAPWLGLPCCAARVLMINYEVPEGFYFDRIARMIDGGPYDLLQVKNNLYIWTWRGFLGNLDDMFNKTEQMIRRHNIEVIVLDPIYKLFSGEDNECSQSSVTALMNRLDRLSRATGVSVIFAHHHPKGNSAKNARAIDRGSGSSAIGRDVDLAIDIMEISLSDAFREAHHIGSDTSAWTFEFVVRNYEPIKPISTFFVFPRHIVDATGVLDDL